MKIAKLGLFRNNWLCFCGNLSTRAGFYPVNYKGDYDWHPLQRSDLYACGHCGRIIKRESGEIVGVTPNFKLSSKDLWLLLVCLQEGGHQPIGLGLNILLAYITPGMRRTLEPWANYALQGDELTVPKLGTR